MIFKQLFDNKSSTYTYIISSGQGREALIIDPVIENTSEYLKVLKELDLKLVKVIDTHIHADHISGLNELSKKTNCSKIMGEHSASEVIDIKVKVSNIGTSSLTKNTVIYRHGTNDLLATGETISVNFDSTSNTSRPLPDNVKNTIEHFENES